MNSQRFKESLSRLPTGVSIITTQYQNKLYGFTANSFTSVSLNPPLVSFCLDKSAKSMTAFRCSKIFAVSILAENQESLSRHFAKGSDHKFLSVDYQIGQLSKCPLINGAICWIECEITYQHEGGDHIIFIGEVKVSTINNNSNPLVYFAHQYRQIK